MATIEGSTRAIPLDARVVSWGVVRALRPRQWVKNGVVFAAPTFALAFDSRSLALAGAVFAAFCAVSSGVYLINDVIDAPKDRLHPFKRYRSIASGVVPVEAAIPIAVVLLAAGLGLALVANPTVAAVVGIYVGVQLAYSFGLKTEPIIDIMCIASGFVLRAIAGAVATGVPMSSWFLLCVALLAFYLGIEKRKAEIRSAGEGGTTRVVLKSYSLPLLLRMESVATGGALLCYTLWALGPGHTSWMLATVPFVAFSLFRYQMLTEQGEGEAPESALLRSPHLMGAIVLWGVTSVGLLAFGSHLASPLR